ncbi:MAG: energy-coupling factor transporter ATPase [Firmicutes bacterium]|nr:energy-coupling factor transporter ATPase [Bacillota bacterium]
MSIEVRNLSHVYNGGLPNESLAIDDVSFDADSGCFLGIIGHTGSGKSTLLQHLNGLLKPSGGTILINEMDVTAEDTRMIEVRRKVGLVFQYPEYQLFEETVEADVSFGPKNLGLSQEEIHERVVEALELVGLNYEEVKDASPFELSGGQKKRVAIAGVLAMNPKILILDEPTAGLDPKGRDDILDQIAELHKMRGITIILVSHSMEDIAKYVERLIVMNHGEAVFDDTPKNVFSHYKELEEMGLAAPQITYIMHALKEKGLAVDADATTVEEAKNSILQGLKSVQSPLLREQKGGRTDD